MASATARKTTTVVTPPVSGPIPVSATDEAQGTNQEATTKRRGRQKGQTVREGLRFTPQQLEALAEVWNEQRGNLDHVMTALQAHDLFEGVDLEGREQTIRDKVYGLRKALKEAGLTDVLVKSPKSRGTRLNQDFIKGLHSRLAESEE